jgi:hypothetical protein
VRVPVGQLSITRSTCLSICATSPCLLFLWVRNCSGSRSPGDACSGDRGRAITRWMRHSREVQGTPCDFGKITHISIRLATKISRPNRRRHYSYIEIAKKPPRVSWPATCMTSQKKILWQHVPRFGASCEHRALPWLVEPALDAASRPKGQNQSWKTKRACRADARAPLAWSGSAPVLAHRPQPSRRTEGILTRLTVLTHEKKNPICT